MARQMVYINAGQVGWDSLLSPSHKPLLLSTQQLLIITLQQTRAQSLNNSNLSRLFKLSKPLEDEDHHAFCCPYCCQRCFCFPCSSCWCRNRHEGPFRRRSCRCWRWSWCRFLGLPVRRVPRMGRSQLLPLRWLPLRRLPLRLPILPMVNTLYSAACGLES
ncbi:uncharacterized protein PGTG_12874 [Puccinia graminis f. sp. tritici CRL 75-36-700-3]|uniref:Uncharacterized protein n=1 Tax=Puccinia graminis f. sp. tritici (strain CRL 75-36-700-3 / race SCCL) TaxID=418459 RepID=E3KSK4_PUCGT|nr:uncharacterized protein PGTG_12874 [Puccinia graminis f. sp. tritici CRL 75-36-700-3]EFP87290.1 hypothetical protein PGTG_12874 [Puccinia graminis f. sp. tritici CRL 75-36-700-3]